MDNEKNDDDEDKDDEIKIVFAPGCFDGFEGTQEELDNLVKELTQMVTDGTLVELSDPLVAGDLDGLTNKQIEELEAMCKMFDDSDDDESTDDAIDTLANERRKKLN